MSHGIREQSWEFEINVDYVKFSHDLVEFSKQFTNEENKAERN